MKDVTVSAPGKLMLSGEWSILEKGNPCVVVAINKRVYAKAKEAPETSVNLKDFNISTKAKVVQGKVEFEEEDEKLVFTKHAIETTLKYLQEKGVKTKNFALETSSDFRPVKIAGREEKIGFGSSAAAVVAITGALLKLHNFGIEAEQEKERLFKLGIIAHYFAQQKIGSGFDVAASTFGGVLAYKRFDAEWLQKELQSRKVSGVVEEQWPLLWHAHVNIPKDLELVVGFTRKSASTIELIQKVRKFKEEKEQEYEGIIVGIKEVTQRLIVALESEDKNKILDSIKENRELLSRLSTASKAGLEVKGHRIMAEIAARNGAEAKFSGAGGGDCAIAVCFDKKIAEKIKKDLKRNNLVPIEVKISVEGAKVEA